ncbi:MAG TPA: alpha/beta fold hydrolase [Vicinamibacterales bacterium]|nr:alpha/beta fold hydrolase [Vicinamibacterales bacterium]
MSDFVPLPRWKGGHWMTLYAWGKPRSFPALPRSTARYFDVAPGSRVLAHCHWQARAWEHPTLILLHGLESSSEAHYVRGLAAKAFAAGFNAVRLNQRNCGATEHLSDGLYHSGLTGDPIAVMRELIAVDGLEAFAIAGYSLGGNLALKLAGDYGSHPPKELRAVCAVSPTMDLAVCVDALEEKQNAIYQWHFVRNLKRRMRRKALAFPGTWSLDALPRIRSIRAFDEAYTAPHHGFRDAADYYHRASAMRVVDQIGIPALIITAADDPFVPPGPFKEPAVVRNPNITVKVTDHGGHCGFVEASKGDYDGYWAEREIMTFIARHCTISTSG